MALVNPNMELVSAHKAQASEGLKNPADAQQFSVELREAADPMCGCRLGENLHGIGRPKIRVW